MYKRKQLVRPPDPRPCFGCTWCGPQPSNGKKAAGALCPVCKWLEGKGWFQWFQEKAGKIIFVDDKGQRHSSVREFLERTTCLVEHLSAKERSALFAKLYTFEIAVKKETPQVETPQQSTRPRRSRLVKSSPKGSAHAVITETPQRITRLRVAKPSSRDSAYAESTPRAATPAMKHKKEVLSKPMKSKKGRTRKSKEEGMIKDTEPASDVARNKSDDESPEEANVLAAFILPKQMSHLEEDNTPATKHRKATSRKRKKLVEMPDPRPAWGCQWCGVANSKSAPDCWKLCIVCQALQDLGWTCRIYSTTQQRFFKLNMITHAGVTAFLIGTTGIVCEALRTISPENLSALHAKYALFQTANQAPRLTKKVVSTEVKKSSSSSANEPPLPKRRRRSAVASNSMKNKKEPSKYVGKSTDSKNIEIELPDISKLLENKKGLSGILEADVFQSYNLNFGTDSNIAARIFISLGRGQLPPLLSKETPFLQSSDETCKLSSSSAVSATCKGRTAEEGLSRFVGVFRIKKTFDNGKEEIGFGATVPQFYVNRDCSSQIDRIGNGYIMPKTSTINGRPLFVRIGINDEDVAGKLFSFMYRLLYGADAVDAVSNILREMYYSKSRAKDSVTGSLPVQTQMPLSTIPVPVSVNIKSTVSLKETNELIHSP